MKWQKQQQEEEMNKRGGRQRNRPRRQWRRDYLMSLIKVASMMESDREGRVRIGLGESPGEIGGGLLRSSSPSVVAQLFCLFICGVGRGRAKDKWGRGCGAEGVSVSVSVSVDLRNSA